MIGVIIIGILICVSVIWTAFEGRNNSCDFDIGVHIGIAIGTLMTIECCLLYDIMGKPKPSALDVYRGNTELEITSVNGTPIDSVVVFKKKNNYGTQNKYRNK